MVYRFRVPPIRTITVPDIESAVAAARTELARTGHEVSPELDAFLEELEAARPKSRLAP